MGTKISQYPELTDPAPDDLLLIDDVDAPGGIATKNIKVSTLLSGLQVTGDTTGAADRANINGLINLGSQAVQLGPGMFYCDSTGILPISGTNLYGGGTTIKMASGVNGAHVIDPSGTTGVTIRNLILDGNGASQTGPSGGEVLGGNTVSGLFCENVTVINGWNQGIYLGANNGASDFAVTGNTCNYNGQNGIQFNNTCSSGSVSGNNCCHNGPGGNQAGILVAGTTTYVTFTGNSCCNNGAYGIQETSPSNYNIYIGNVCHGNGVANLVTSGANDVVANNITT